jgi:hypothetical protein
MAKRCLIILERKFHLGNPGLTVFVQESGEEGFKRV